ncbi:hypothetical protein PYW07_012963 [Mythimna separata]|uniref:ZAD domain-containing protein n=1 Tax=Mythimna separata TaxID=271217 RepID=A0AAD7Y951_MYTSE|nr:hypothetical protein PYW07_012963 [Mythimna separata]
MEKLPLCRLCLAENVRMFIVVNKDLHDLYERLTDNPFVTEDSRPMLACFMCYTKLKQCCQLQRKCLEAEELLTQMMNDDELRLKQDHFGCFNELTVASMVHVTIASDDECQTECDAIKEELPDVCERLDDVIEPEEEHQSDELENLYNSHSNAENIPAEQSESDSEEDVHDTLAQQSESDAEEDVPDTPAQQSETDSEENAEDIPAQQSEPDSEEDVPLVEIKTKVRREREVSRKKRGASDTTPEGSPDTDLPQASPQRPVLCSSSSDSCDPRDLDDQSSTPPNRRKKRANIDLATRNEIIELHHEGLNMSEIAREMGLNVKTQTERKSRQQSVRKDHKKCHHQPHQGRKKKKIVVKHQNYFLLLLPISRIVLKMTLLSSQKVGLSRLED